MADREKRKRAKDRRRRQFQRTHQPTDISDKKMSSIARHRPNVLQDIETVLAAAWRRDPAIDDARCMRARALHLGDEELPDNPLLANLVGYLDQVSDLRDDVPDDAWRDAVRAVGHSICNHSAMRPGQRDYLRFIEDYLP